VYWSKWHLRFWHGTGEVDTVVAAAVSCW